jgi:hypothetical protein
MGLHVTATNAGAPEVTSDWTESWITSHATRYGLGVSFTKHPDLNSPVKPHTVMSLVRKDVFLIRQCLFEPKCALSGECLPDVLQEAVPAGFG